MYRKETNHSLELTLTEYLSLIILYVKCVDPGDDWAGLGIAKWCPIALVSWVSYSRACKTGNRGDAERVWNRQAMRPRYFMRQRKEFVKSNDMEVPSVGASHTLQMTAHKYSVTDSPANTRNVVGQCCNSICRIRKSHMKVYALFQQNKKTY